MNVDLHELTKFCKKRDVDLSPAQAMTLVYVMGACEANGVGRYDWDEFEFNTHQYLNKTDYEAVFSRLRQSQNVGFFKQYCITYYQLPLYVDWNSGLRRKANSNKAPYPPWVRFIPDKAQPSQGCHKVDKELFSKLLTYSQLIDTPNCSELADIISVTKGLLPDLTNNSRELTGLPSSSSSTSLKALKDLLIKESFKEGFVTPGFTELEETHEATESPELDLLSFLRDVLDRSNNPKDYIIRVNLSQWQASGFKEKSLSPETKAFMEKHLSEFEEKKKLQ